MAMSESQKLLAVTGKGRIVLLNIEDAYGKFEYMHSFILWVLIYC